MKHSLLVISLVAARWTDMKRIGQAARDAGTQLILCPIPIPLQAPFAITFHFQSSSIQVESTLARVWGSLTLSHVLEVNFSLHRNDQQALKACVVPDSGFTMHRLSTVYSTRRTYLWKLSWTKTSFCKSARRRIQD
jgi:hypothetical protein